MLNGLVKIFRESLYILDTSSDSYPSHFAEVVTVNLVSFN